MESIGVIIVAGGHGNRMGASQPKQFMLLDGQPILARTINVFAKALPGAPIVVVLPESHIGFWANLAARFDVAKHKLVTGGEMRFNSVRKGLDALPEECELIAVHDGVRPLVSTELILSCAHAASQHGSAIPVMEPVDTFRKVDGSGSHMVDRHLLRAVQTPQIFRSSTLREAYKVEFLPSFTDDASVVEAAGGGVFLCDGEARNIKITTLDDLLFAEAIVAEMEVVDELLDDNLDPSVSHGHSTGGSCCRSGKSHGEGSGCCSSQSSPIQPWDDAGAGAIK